MNPHELTEPAAVEPDASIDRHVSRKRLIAGLPLALGALFFAKRPDEAFAGTDGDWKLTGNAVQRKQSLGTTNDKPLLIKTKNIIRMRISGGGDVGIGPRRPAPGCTSRTREPLRSRCAAFRARRPDRPGALPGRSTPPEGSACSGRHRTASRRRSTPSASRARPRSASREPAGTWASRATRSNYAVFGYTTPDTGGIGVYGRGRTGVKGRSYIGLAVLGDTDTGTGVKGEAYGGRRRRQGDARPVLRLERQRGHRRGEQRHVGVRRLGHQHDRLRRRVLREGPRDRERSRRAAARSRSTTRSTRRTSTCPTRSSSRRT